eukprot:NODE_130_length_3565_cov_11.236184.p1 GENE.NODE_130_length_3565_cov_11.236184~~NODE_130_length_3565_cov_11.236184.p1  ORF type:complete len:897 (+),score=351.11 NODE_130_length_3565_cov_11.236184:113-2803(+)
MSHPGSPAEDLLGEDEEDVLAAREVGDEEDEEEEGEDLFGGDMAGDYVARPELDRYDESMVDDTEHAPMTMDQRRAAERAIRERERRERRERASAAPSPDARFPAEPSSPLSSDSGPEFTEEVRDTPRRRRRRTEGSPEQADRSEDDLDEEHMPANYYDLTHEIFDGTGMEQRLITKIKRCFQQFLLRFHVEGQADPHYPDEITKMAEENQMHLNVNYRHIQQWSPPLALWVAEYPLRILPILRETLMTEADRRFDTYRQIRKTDENELAVGINDFPLKDPIRELCTWHLNKMVWVRGVVTKRSAVFNQVKRLHLKCAKCGFPSGPFDVQDEKEFRPGACVECQSKGPWMVHRQKTLYQNHQKITLQESPGGVEPGKMPRSKEVILTGDMVDTVRPGDELELTAVYRCLYDVATNARTCFPVYKTDLKAVHVQRKGEQRIERVTDHEHQAILELAKTKNIRERIIASIAPSIYGMKHVKTAIALSMMGGRGKVAAGKHRIRGDINVLIVGDPGLAKSQFLKYVEQTFPRAVYTTGKGATGVGLTAAVTRGENGDFCLEGGAMVLADDGICLIDEFDKMNDKDRTSIHEAMEQQSISISKAGIVATLQARCAVIAVGNPAEGRYDPQRTFADNVRLSDPILSRFDVLCVLRDEADVVQDEQLADHVICSHIRSHPEASSDDRSVQPRLRHRQQAPFPPIEQELLQKYIIYARKHVQPQLSDLEKDKLAGFYRDIRAKAYHSGGAPMTARHIESIIRLTEANARLELRSHVLPRDLDNAIATTLESFIQSQKHQVAEELRKEFRRYIVHATPLHDQFMELLEKLFKDKTEQMQNSRRGLGAMTDSAVVEAADVAVDMEEVVQQIQRRDYDLNEAYGFMRSDRFRQNFRTEGELIYRLL